MKINRTLTILITFALGFYLGNKNIDNIIESDNVSSLETNNKDTTSSMMPECIAGLCPRYFSMNVTKGLTQSYSVVVQPTHMTKGAGKVLVIAGGEVEFTSPIYAQIGVEKDENSDGFWITHKSGENYDVEERIKVDFDELNGTFILTDSNK